MKIQGKTWIWLALALSLAGFVYVTENGRQQQSQPLTTQQQRLFNFTPAEIKTLTIETPRQTLVFAQNKQKQSQWLMVQPEAVEAKNSTVMFLVNLLVSGQSNRSFKITASEKSNYGLTQPQATITIELNNQEKQQLVLGQTNFDENLIYAQINPQQDNQETITIKLLPITFYYAVDRDLREWKEE